jgi:outer membrane protein assembly factor BamD (BamD/ComL family)
MNTDRHALGGKPRTRDFRGQWLSAVLVSGLLGFAGCRQKSETAQQRYDAARTLYEQTTKNLHLPSASATGQEQQRLQTEAARAYEKLLKHYPEQEYWCAKALCNLGSVQAAQTNYAAALRSWSEVTTKYPRAEWEVLTALKSAADLQWDTGHQGEARVLYQKLVAEFDRTNAPAVVRTIVRGSRLKLQTPPSRSSSETRDDLP